MASESIPVAQYLRMSTEHQKYSLENQQLAIRKYAEDHGFSVVQTYADRARSGLVLQNRPGLRELLHDVTRGTVAFKAILVYDVSRWGRFQDSDESAHYEFLCKQAGIPIHYCAELFANDDTLASVLIKAIKRSMAAEYSRELGVKSLAGQRHVFQRGFKGGGGRPGYGLQRMLISNDGRQRLLRSGERKALTTDRVILVPGPEAEVTCIREICRLFLEDKYTFSAIARRLNESGVPYHNQVRWRPGDVRKILTNTKYNGWLVYGKTSRKLHMKEKKQPESEWLRVKHPTAKVIDDATFAAVQKRIANFTNHKSNQQLLDELRAILAANSRLNSTIIRNSADTTPAGSLRRRFGSLMQAYDLIGYHVPIAQLVQTRKRIQSMRQELMQRIEQANSTEIRVLSKGGRTRSWLQVRNGIKVSVRFCARIAHVHSRAWYVREAVRESRWITLLVLLNHDNTRIEQSLVFPRVPSTLAYLSAESPWLKKGIQLDDVERFCEIVKKVYSERDLGKTKERQ